MSTYADTPGEMYLPRLSKCSLEFEVRQAMEDGADLDDSIAGRTYVLRLADDATAPVVLSKEITATGSLLTFDFEKGEITIEAGTYLATVWEEPDHKPLHPINIVIPVRDVVGGSSL